MKVAFLIDKESIFNTHNFIRLLNEVAKKENLAIDFIMAIKKCKFYDFVFSLTDKYVDSIENKYYNIYPLYMDDNIKEFVNNDLFYSKEYFDEYEYEELFYYEKSIISKVLRDFKEKNNEYVYASGILNEYKTHKEDFMTLEGECPILISAPHNVSQYYKGMYKPSDLNTGKLAINVADRIRCFGIIKTKNIGSVFKDDNANRQLKCPYRKKIKQIINDNDIKALIDIHTLRRTRKEQVNFGINGGENLFDNKQCLNELIDIAKKHGFIASIDKPFKGGQPTISNYARHDLGVYSLQIEINSKYINHVYRSSKYDKLVDMICEIGEYFNSIKKAED